VASQPGLVAVISDFRDQQGWERPLGSLRIRHSVLAVEIVDPREAELPAVGHLTLVDPETGARIEVNLMAQIAQVSGARAFNAQSADQLSTIYRRLGSELGTVSRQREITFAFAAAGVVLLAAAAVGSVRWSGRLP